MGAKKYGGKPNEEKMERGRKDREPDSGYNRDIAEDESQRSTVGVPKSVRHKVGKHLAP